MNPSHDQALAQAAEETLANMAFLFPSGDAPGNGLGDGAGGPETAAAVEYHGPGNGMVCISASRALLPSLAANMLGLDDPSTAQPEQQNDAFKELLNVITGNLLPLIDSPQNVYNIDAPRMLPEGPLPLNIDGFDPAGQADLQLDEGSVHLRLFLRAA